MRREMTQINQVRHEKEREQQTPRKSWESLGTTFKNLYSNKLENLEETDKFLNTNGHPKLNQETIVT
jgi:hypothetical protein